MCDLELYTPKRGDLWFRQALLSDPDTMNYNKGYDLDFPEYHRDTGCVDFPEENWDGWYARWVRKEPERFYAYLRRKADGAFLGQVSLHPGEEAGWFEMEIVLHIKYRGRGYSAEGMELLLRHAFEDMSAAGVSNRFERTREAAWRLHEKAGFQPADEKDGIVTIVLSKERYLEQREREELKYTPRPDLDFTEMQAIQRKLQEKYFDKWGGLSPEKGRQTLLWMLIEVGEAADVIKKRGDQAILNDPETRGHFIEELCDVMMYFNDLLLCYGVTPEEFSRVYREKHEKNMKRW